MRRFANIATCGAALVSLVLPLQAQQRRSLGPVDGVNLSPLDTGRVTVGMMAPDFTLESKDGDFITLSDLRGKKHVVLVFYRGHW